MVIGILDGVLVIIYVEGMDSVMKTSRQHVQMSTSSSSQLHVIQMMMFQIMKLCVRGVRADVVIGAPIVISAIVTVTVEDGTGAAKTSRQHVQRKTDTLYPPHVIHVMTFQTIRHYASHVRADVVIGAPIVTSVIVTVTVEDQTDAAKTSR